MYAVRLCVAVASASAGYAEEKYRVTNIIMHGMCTRAFATELAAVAGNVRTLPIHLHLPPNDDDDNDECDDNARNYRLIPCIHFRIALRQR